MIILDARKIGNKLLEIRKRCGMTQSEVAEAADICDRTYADIERGAGKAKLETVLQICRAMHITPDDILTDQPETQARRQEELIERLNACDPQSRETALRLLEVYLESLK